ncbi:MAG: glycosyltransferase family 4 protein [Terriglobales bacterium]|jgi:glycosyltransferase involved in cell wall biosynthesis
MTKSVERKLAVAVLLSGREKFSSYYGGALARWTYEAYRHLTSELDVKVFGFPTPAEDLYPLPHETSHSWRLCKIAQRIPVVRRYEDRLWLSSLSRRLQQVDVVHIHNRPQWAFILRQLGLQGRIVVHLQNDHLGHWTTPMLDALAPAVDAVVTCSTYLRDTFAPRSSSLARKTHVVFNGVNTEVSRPCENLREPKTILFVGRFDPEKGVLQLVRAYALVLKDHPDAKLIIGGGTGFGTHHETPYVSQVQAMARSIQQNCGAAIQFTGYIHHDRDLPACFQRASVFACPSLFQEPFGLVNAEAMACATAIVGSNRGGIPEVLGDAGKVVDPENVEGFSSALSELLANPERRRQLGQAGYQRAIQTFDWRVVAQNWAGLLRQLVCK